MEIFFLTTVSKQFFEECKKHIGKSKRYLTNEQTGGNDDDEWKLVVPDDFENMKNRDDEC